MPLLRPPGDEPDAKVWPWPRPEDQLPVVRKARQPAFDEYFCGDPRVSGRPRGNEVTASFLLGSADVVAGVLAMGFIQTFLVPLVRGDA
jgi:hypothetical protein